MTSERFGIIKFKGQEATVVGADLKAGEAAPEFSAHTLDWSAFNGLAGTQGKVRIIAAVPSLDTEVCDRETRRFNQEASSLSKDIAILVISTDLPFAQKRWCGAAGVENLKTYSDHREAAFGLAYGVLIKELRLLARAVFVVDKGGKVRHVQLVEELANEPDYEAVLQAVRGLV